MPDHLGGDPVPRCCDVAIVGAGATGLRAARVLAAGGATVVVLEAGEIASGASSRSGGQALVGLKDDASQVARRFGLERARRFWEAAHEALRGLVRICAEEGVECDLRPCGSLYLAARSSHLDDMLRESEWLARHFGYERPVLSRRALASEIGSDVYHGAALDTASHSLHPGKWARALALAAHRAGATLCAHTRVRAIDRVGAGHTLALERGSLRATEVLVTTNGYTDRAFPGLRARVIPVESAILATEPLSRERRDTTNPKDRLFYDSKWCLHYFRHSPDGRMIFGGRGAAAPRWPFARTARRLEREMLGIFPSLRGVRVTHCWSGRVALCVDGMPHIGRHRGVHYALGYGGHGVALSTLLGQHVAEIVAGRRESSPFSEIPHPTRVTGPWFRPLRVAKLRLLDRIG